jgi:hypothetical protein
MLVGDSMLLHSLIPEAFGNIDQCATYALTIDG